MKCSQCTQPATKDGRCDTHARKAWKNTSARNSDLPSDWNSRRSKVRRRDKGICYWCGSPGAWIVDHLIEVADGGSHELDNLALIHEHCHEIKTKRAREARKLTK